MRDCFYIHLFLNLFGEFINDSTRVIIALEGPTADKPSLLEEGYPGRSFFGKIISFIFGGHVLLTEVTTFKIKVFAVVFQQLREEADLDLVLERRRAISIHESALLVDVGVQIKAEMD
jgi:hypothetical protein